MLEIKSITRNDEIFSPLKMKYISDLSALVVTVQCTVGDYNTS